MPSRITIATWAKRMIGTGTEIKNWGIHHQVARGAVPFSSASPDKSRSEGRRSPSWPYLSAKLREMSGVLSSGETDERINAVLDPSPT